MVAHPCATINPAICVAGLIRSRLGLAQDQIGIWDNLFCVAGLEKISKLIGHEGLAEIIALEEIAAVFFQQGKLGRLFDPFGNHLVPHRLPAFPSWH